MRRIRNVFGVGLIVVFFAFLGSVSAESDKGPVLLAQLRSFGVAQGEAPYERYCLFCHGESGRGDGMNGFNLPVRPFDFSDQKSMAVLEAERIRQVVLKGGKEAGLNPAMPAFGATISTRQLNSLVEYLKTFPLRPPAPAAGEALEEDEDEL